MIEMSKGEFLSLASDRYVEELARLKSLHRSSRGRKESRDAPRRPRTERPKHFNPNQVEFLKSFHCVVEKKKKDDKRV